MRIRIPAARDSWITGPLVLWDRHCSIGCLKLTRKQAAEILSRKYGIIEGRAYTNYRRLMVDWIVGSRRPYYFSLSIQSTNRVKRWAGIK